MPTVKPNFSVLVKPHFMCNLSIVWQNQGMLDDAERAKRLRRAMDDRHPRVTSTHIAEVCGVTPQAVYAWRTTGQIDKDHLPAIAVETQQSVWYFLVKDYEAMQEKDMSVADLSNVYGLSEDEIHSALAAVSGAKKGRADRSRKKG